MGEQASARELSGVRALVLEDDVDTRELMAALLTRAGADVISAAGATVALAILQHWRPDVILVDLGLKNFDGCTFLSTLRELPETAGRDAVAIAVTGYDPENSPFDTDSVRFDARVQKPVRPSELRRLVRMTTDERRRRVSHPA
jgi:CheY-like chemotaxis protein